MVGISLDIAEISESTSSSESVENQFHVDRSAEEIGTFTTHHNPDESTDEINEGDESRTYQKGSHI